LSTIGTNWIITILAVLFWVWRLHVLGWFSDREAANAKIADKSRGNESPALSLIMISLGVGSYNVFSLLVHRLTFGASLTAETYQVIAQYLIICTLYFFWPFLRGLRADDQVRAISWMVAGAFVLGSVIGPLFTFFHPA